MPVGIGIFCSTCGSSGTVAKVTPGLQCRCGSTDLGLEGVDPKPSFALKQARELAQATAGVVAPGGTGWGKPHPSATEGWSSYVGPPPTPNPYPVRDVPRWPCPECQGSGYDLIDKGPCKACGGTGHHAGPTSQPPILSLDPHAGRPPGGAGWHGAARTITPVRGPESKSAAPRVQPPAPNRSRPATASSATGPRRPGSSVMSLNASCPTCDATRTHLAADRSGHGWWCCAKCGSLADLDRHPGLDPFLPAGFVRDGSMRVKASRLRRDPQNGRLLALIATVQAQNAVSNHEALTLARAALQKHPA